MKEMRSSKFSISKSWLLIFLTGCLILTIQLGRLALFAYTPLVPGSSEFSSLEVTKGQGPNDLTRILANQKVISDPKSFIWLGRLTRQWKRVKAGEYKVSASMTPVEIFSILTSGISLAHPITIREGENSYEIADDLATKGLGEAAQFLALCRSPALIKSIGSFGDNPPQTLEGYLFPDTNFFNRTMSQEDMIRHMVRHFFENWGKVQEDRARELGLNRHQVTTLASIIEKETGVPEERPLISSVFHNRLKKRMKLQSDPTTIYGMWERYEGKIHRSDLLEANPYNTYHVSALPIGPIGNPGKEAIQAALYPVTSSFLFFVSHNDGTHEFSKTIQEHNRAVARFQLNPKAREGKSWRDYARKSALKGKQPPVEPLPKSTYSGE